MIVPLAPETWKMLRVIVRSPKKGPVLGKDLRIIPSRKTKDGTFLDALVKVGLIEVRSGPAAKTPDEDEPAQFRTKYGLTDLGEHAAEYGEYEVEVPGATADAPVKGLMAELLKAKGNGNGSGKAKGKKPPAEEPEPAEVA